MQEKGKYSSKEIIDDLLANNQSTLISQEQLQEMERDIREHMAKYAITERLRAARAAEGMRKIIITA